MTLHATLSESCLKYSIKRYFVDNLYTAENIELDFDVKYVDPKDISPTNTKWVSIKFGAIEGGTLSRSHIIVYVCTRKDNEGVDLSNLRDIVMDKIIDENQTDGIKRIPYYDSTPTQIGAMLPILTLEQEEPGVLDDGTKFKWMRIDLHWGAK